MDAFGRHSDVGMVLICGQYHLGTLTRALQRCTICMVDSHAARPWLAGTDNTELYIIGQEVADTVQLAATLSTSCSSQQSPTSLQPTAAMVTARLACIAKGHVVLDPFVGAGSLLHASRQCGASIVVGSDVDATFFGSPTACMRPSQLGTCSMRQQEQQQLGTSDSVSCPPKEHSLWQHTHVNGNRDGGSGKGRQTVAMSTTTAELALADALQTMWRPNSFDAIICDPPYGVRAQFGGSVSELPPHTAASSHRQASKYRGSPPVEPVIRHAEKDQSESTASCSHGDSGNSVQWEDMMKGLYRLAGRCLVTHGRLVCWLPCKAPQVTNLRRWLKVEANGHGLCLLHMLCEQRQSGVARGIAVLYKKCAATDCGAVLAAAELGIDGVSTVSLGSMFNTNTVQTGFVGGGQQYSEPVDGPASTNMAESSSLRVIPRAAAPAIAATDRRHAELGRTQRYAVSRKQHWGAGSDVWRAAWRGDVAALQSYLSAGGDENAVDGKGQTPLQFAAGYGQLRAVQVLLDACAKVNQADAGKTDGAVD